MAILLVLLAGVAVGATSIGGVLVVPVLTHWAGTGTEIAIAASSFAFAFTGAAAFLTGRDKKAGSNGNGSGNGSGGNGSGSDNGIGSGSGSAGTAAHAASAGGGWPLQVCALLGAALGALTLAWLPSAWVRTGVGALAVASGLYALSGIAARRGTVPAASPWLLAPLGLLVGCASAWSGTGGPVLLLPLLTLLGWPALLSVAAAQRIQLPVALSATAVNLAAGRLDVALGLGIGVLVLAGWAAGRWLARHLDTLRLQQGVAVALIATGLWYL